MTFIKKFIFRLLNRQISKIYSKRFQKYNNTPKGVFWNSKLSQDLRLNIILDKVMSNLENNKVSIADIGCGYGRLFEIIKEKSLENKIQYNGFDINQNLIKFCNSEKKFKGGNFELGAFPSKGVDYVIMSGTYNLSPTNSKSLWEYYILENLRSNWDCVKKGMILNCLIKDSRKIEKTLYYTELSWIRELCEKNFSRPEILKHHLLKDDATIILKK